MESNNRIQPKSKLWLGIGMAVAVVILLLVWILGGDDTKDHSPPTETGTAASTEAVTTAEQSVETTEIVGTSVSETTVEEMSPETTMETQPPVTETESPTEPYIPPTEPETTEPETQEQPDADLITCEQFARFSGQFVEDGRDELVENVAAILVTNRSGQFIDLCTLEYEVDGKTAVFVITGLPAGRSAWIMESTRLVIPDDAQFKYADCVSALRPEVITSTDKITITSDGNMLTAVNNTSETLEGVYIYYKTLHTDGNFFGGITYLVDFGDLEPGMAMEKLAGHYKEGTTEIVRIGWKDS